MSEQITVRLEDTLSASARAAAAAAGVTLTSWVRSAIAHQAALDTALRARAQEDARAPLYTGEQQDALMTSRRRRGLTAFDRAASDRGASDR